MIRLVYGGSFDPIHVGHLNLLRAGVKHLRNVHHCEKFDIRIVPAYQANFKSCHFASYQDRYNMVSDAVSNDWYLSDAGVKVDAYEGAAARRVYTHEYLQAIGATSDDPVWVLCGADIIPRLDDWCNAELLSRLCRVLVGISKGDTVTLPEMKNRFSIELISNLITGQVLDGRRLSSTAIRRRLSIGEDVAAFLPSTVSDYIRTHNLYRSLETA